MGVAVKFGDRLRGISTFLEAEFDSVVAGFNALLERQHNLLNGSHGDITADSLDTNASNGVLPVNTGLRYTQGPWWLDLVGNNSHVAGIRPPTWTANQDDYYPAGIDNAIMLEVDSDAARSITGIRQPFRQKRFLFFGNRGNYIITLKHNVTSTARYRFGLPANQDFAVGPSSYHWLYYDVGSEVWRLIGIPEPVSCEAYRSADQSIPSGAYTKVTLNAETWDPYAVFDTVTNNRFTASVAGKYWVSARAVLDGPSQTQCAAAIYKNGTIYKENLTGVGLDNGVTVHIATMIDCVAADYLEFFVLQNRGVNINLLGTLRYNSFNVSLFGG